LISRNRVICRVGEERDDGPTAFFYFFNLSHTKTLCWMGKQRWDKNRIMRYEYIALLGADSNQS